MKKHQSLLAQQGPQASRDGLAAALDPDVAAAARSSREQAIAALREPLRRLLAEPYGQIWESVLNEAWASSPAESLRGDLAWVADAFLDGWQHERGASWKREGQKPENSCANTSCRARAFEAMGWPWKDLAPWVAQAAAERVKNAGPRGKEGGPVSILASGAAQPDGAVQWTQVCGQFVAYPSAIPPPSASQPWGACGAGAWAATAEEPIDPTAPGARLARGAGLEALEEECAAAIRFRARQYADSMDPKGDELLWTLGVACASKNLDNGLKVDLPKKGGEMIERVNQLMMSRAARKEREELAVETQSARGDSGREAGESLAGRARGRVRL